MEKGLSDERVLLEKIAGGDEDAFRVLFNAYRNLVYTYALRILQSKDAAEDVVQDVFLKLWLKKHDLPEISVVDAYLPIVTRNHILKILRRKGIETQTLGAAGQHPNDYHNETQDLIEYNDTKRILEHAIDKLPPRQQMVYRLCHREGLSYDEAALRLGISSLTVKTHMQQALRSIRHFLKNNTDVGISSLLPLSLLLL